MKSFSEAAKYISVDAGVVQRSVDWLMGGQMENGCFPKRGYTHSSYLKGGGSDSTLTPFIGETFDITIWAQMLRHYGFLLLQ